MFIAALALLIAVIVVLQTASTNEYALTPGDATPVAPLVTIKGNVSTNAHPSKIMLVDVYLSSLSAWQWITMHFQSHVQFVPGDELVEPGVSTSELGAQGFLEMSDAKQAAEVAAFRVLGWKVPATPTGAVVTAVVNPSPASRAKVAVGDKVVGVNGTAIHTGCQLVSYVHDLAPGTAVALRVSKVKISAIGNLSYAAVTTVHVTTTSAPSADATSACPGVSGPDKSFLGIGLENGNDYVLPATVNINTANIGGPSAGLAMTLTLINKLSHGSLTGGHVVAATGTMATNGQVGAVGGVEEKAVAAHNAGAQYFIVPNGDGDVDAARAANEPGLTILPVTSLNQALKDLRKLGGTKPVAITTP
ncbi:MAG TPA: S16 family serine protease [Acidimicrobiales bacterium]|nr:S16 family serine protease [Acidimicrobiales bacterium]